MDLVFVLAVGLIAGIISGIVGTGSSIMLMPVLAYAYGPKAAVPIMAVAALMANLSRIVVWVREVDWRKVGAYAATGAPAAFLGARTMLVLPSRWVDIAIGCFLLAMIPARRIFAAAFAGFGLVHLAVAGAVIGFLTGIVASTGPISVPVFLAAGLTKGAFLGTEAASSLMLYVAKTVSFRSAGALPTDEILKGLTVGASIMAGSFISKPFVLRLSADRFQHLMDALLGIAGLAMLYNAAFAP
ncbi:sulfite exporter TauE/SafE [Variibacter gotjawalensis]|uniref:Probable membrane transporter protein n=1 Tax=Variibacter gotjawalensis TaxID=1333996 RepID=A0A0S3PPL9_9BRAD|nr:sulfite exporter TauE/SafE family protein [Variibacter gotjawalensis]NIK48124.1 hypothetical protein [Variibacter gotjawalensis]RZS50000.1 hypothetical protein EV661_2448 [Variibacter gotjawalensis]BAT57827.1 sulfite exporter TauE/SafE [Variibacter gotjawalensis]